MRCTQNIICHDSHCVLDIGIQFIHRNMQTHLVLLWSNTQLCLPISHMIASIALEHSTHDWPVAVNSPEKYELITSMNPFGTLNTQQKGKIKRDSIVSIFYGTFRSLIACSYFLQPEKSWWGVLKCSLHLFNRFAPNAINMVLERRLWLIIHEL